MSVAPSILIASLFAHAIGPLPLTLADATARARLHHPDVLRAISEANVALSRRVGAAMVLPESPHVSLAAGRRHDSSASTPASTGPEWTVQLGQMVEVAGQRGARLREVGWAATVAHLHTDEARLAAAAASAQDFVRAQAAEAAIEVAEARLHLAEQVLTMVQDKELAGAIGGIERTLAQVELSVAQAQLLEARGQSVSAHEALWLSLGLPAGTTWPLAPLQAPEDPLDTPADGQDADAYLSQLLAQATRDRPLAQANLAAQEAAQATLTRLGREAVPNPTVFVEAQHQQPGQQYFGAGLNMAIPVVQRLQGPRAEALAQHARTTLERTLFVRKLRTEITTAWAQRTATAQMHRTVHDAQLPAAKNHADMTVAAWRAGKLELLNVVQSLRFLAEARLQHTEAVAGLWRAHIELTRATGRSL